MANLAESSIWETGVYQIEENDPVHGGANGITNRPTKQLANRTVWLKNELASSVQAINANLTSLSTNKADKTLNLVAGNGLTGGGTLQANRTLTLGTPSQITASTTNSVTATSHTHAIDKASTTVAGIVQLVDNLTTDDATKALTASQGKVLNDKITATDAKADTKANSATTITAGNGLTGGGTLQANRTLTLGTPSQITASTTNSVTATSHTHAIDKASTTVAGIVQLVDNLTTDDATKALTASQGKVLNDKITATDAKADTKANSATTITAGNGLTGGGTLQANRTLTLGTPSQITASTTNSVTATSHTHAIDKASTTVAGVVQLVDNLTTDDATKALTAKQGRVLNDKIDNISVGGRNLLLSTANVSATQNKQTRYFPVLAMTQDKLESIRVLILSCDIHLKNAIRDTSDGAKWFRIGCEIRITCDDDTVHYAHCWHYVDQETNVTSRIKRAFYVPAGKTIKQFGNLAMQIWCINADQMSVSNPKLEIGNIATDWSPAPEDKAELVHTHPWSQITDAPSSSTTAAGIVQLNDTLVSTATDQALTANQGKVLNDKITATDAKADTKVNRSGDVMTGYLTLSNQPWPKVQLASSSGNQALLLESDGKDGTHCLIIRRHENGTVINGNIARFNLPTVTGTKIFAVEDGNIATATKLQTPRTINGVAFNGTQNITIYDNTKLPTAGGTMTGTLYAHTSGIKGGTDIDSGIEWPQDGVVRIVADSKERIKINFDAVNLYSVHGDRLAMQNDKNLVLWDAGGTVLWSSKSTTDSLADLQANKAPTVHRHNWSEIDGKPSNLAYTTSNVASATKLATARTINGVAFNGTQNITIYDNTKLASNGNAVSASRLATARTISLTGAVTGSVSFNGSANVSIATALNLAEFANSKTGNGYQKLPNGLIIQWGDKADHTYVTFPIAFPNKVLNVSLTLKVNSRDSDNMESFGVNSVSNAGFSIFNWVSPSQGCYWLAIGY